MKTSNLTPNRPRALRRVRNTRPTPKPSRIVLTAEQAERMGLDNESRALSVEPDDWGCDEDGHIEASVAESKLRAAKPPKPRSRIRRVHGKRVGLRGYLVTRRAMSADTDAHIVALTGHVLGQREGESLAEAARRVTRDRDQAVEQLYDRQIKNGYLTAMLADKSPTQATHRDLQTNGQDDHKRVAYHRRVAYVIQLAFASSDRPAEYLFMSNGSAAIFTPDLDNALRIADRAMALSLHWLLKVTRPPQEPDVRLLSIKTFESDPVDATPA